jgi:NitT/TauT family transport system permease protein
MPALVTIVLCYVWFGLTEAAAIIAVALNKIPNVAVTLREGARSLEPGFDDVAKIYRFGWAKKLQIVILPQLEPYLAAAVRSGLALIWKIVLVVELLGRSNGVGFQIQMYFQNFDIGRILAYALAFIAIVQAIESGLIRPWEQRLRRWRLDDAQRN